MQIVIDIPEEEYEGMVNSEDCGLHTLTRAIANGTPLPKGHGRLIDIDDATKDIDTVMKYFTATILDGVIVGVACSAPTVLEADKESKNDDI